MLNPKTMFKETFLQIKSDRSVENPKQYNKGFVQNKVSLLS